MEEGLDQADNRQRAARFGLDRQGMRHLGPVHWNLTAPFLYEHAVRRGEGELGFGGSFVVKPAPHRPLARATNTSSTSPAPRTRSGGATSTSRSLPERFDSLQQRMLAYLQGRELFVQDLYAGADPEYRLPVRVVSDSAWHSLFSRNMFIRPPAGRAGGLRAGLHDPARARISARSRNSTGSAPRPSSSSISPSGWC